MNYTKVQIKPKLYTEEIREESFPWNELPKSADKTKTIHCTSVNKNNWILTPQTEERGKKSLIKIYRSGSFEHNFNTNQDNSSKQRTSRTVSQIHVHESIPIVPALLIISHEITKTAMYHPSYTSLGQILQLCRVSSLSIHLSRRSCAYMTFGQTKRQMDRVIPIYTSPPPPTPQKKQQQQKKNVVCGSIILDTCKGRRLKFALIQTLLKRKFSAKQLSIYNS